MKTFKYEQMNTTRHIFTQNIFNGGSRLLLPLPLFVFFVSFQLYFSCYVLFSEGVSGYSYCRRWLLINRVPGYQPTHDWLFSTKHGEKKKRREGWGVRVAPGNHEACVDLKRDSGKSSGHLCVRWSVWT